MLNVWGAVLSALIGAAGWVTFAFIGAPIRRFLDLRGEVALALNRFARVVSEPPVVPELLSAVVEPMITRATAAQEFRRLGLALISFWQNEPLAPLLLKSCGFDGATAGLMLLNASEAAMSTATLGPRRSEITSPLKLKI